jgi:hypothetical protein
MSRSTPADLAVTFRSLARRQREAIGDADPAPLRGFVDEIEGHVAAAAAALGIGGDAAALAAAIERRPADSWDEATLGALQQEALAAGAVLRRLAAAAEAQQEQQ